MLKIHNISRYFKQKHRKITALDNVSLDIKKGEFLGIVGPSGSGKSTLLLIMGGMSKPDTGKMYFNQQSLYDLSHDQRCRLRSVQIGFVFQSFNLIPYLSVYENISVALDLSNGKADNNKKEKILSIISDMKLTDRMDHLPNELSVGQQQRVAIARALVKDPEIIFADEPTGNLDPETSEEIMTIFQSQNKKGKTVVLITHDPSLATITDRLVRIVNGRIVE